jgi:hypothetical protein
VISELPNPVNFEAATASVREEDVAEDVSCGADAGRHAEAIERWASAGFDRMAIVALGDIYRFFELWEQELRPRLESIAVSGAGWGRKSASALTPMRRGRAREAAPV